MDQTHQKSQIPALQEMQKKPGALAGGLVLSVTGGEEGLGAEVAGVSTSLQSIRMKNRLSKSRKGNSTNYYIPTVKNKYLSL